LAKPFLVNIIFEGLAGSNVFPLLEKKSS